MFIKDPANRAYIYGITAAAGGLALIYGLVNAAQLGGWLALSGAVLGLTNVLALANTNKGDHEA
ncbi:holin [Arthrobacter phage Jasmine]|uniref:Holin n=1 Tax=Arthrobacter phage Jasmine TaxID=1772302 RepID=A0A0U4IEP6_9CAUD|nr:holin [Arthrobacter phage Jasmine]ALY09302.1 holin [Arthrobacter phage Jasmine]